MADAKRRWLNWYTRYFEGVVVARPCEFESHPAHQENAVIVYSIAAFLFYIPFCVHHHLLKIQRLSEARVSGCNLLRSTESERSDQKKIYKISARRARG